MLLTSWILLSNDIFMITLIYLIFSLQNSGFLHGIGGATSVSSKMDQTNVILFQKGPITPWPIITPVTHGFSAINITGSSNSLVGGFNPFEKYARQIGESFPNRDNNKKVFRTTAQLHLYITICYHHWILGDSLGSCIGLLPIKYAGPSTRVQNHLFPAKVLVCIHIIYIYMYITYLPKHLPTFSV